MPTRVNRGQSSARDLSRYFLFSGICVISQLGHWPMASLELLSLRKNRGYPRASKLGIKQTVRLKIKSVENFPKAKSYI